MNRYRQYGLWERYSDIYRDSDLVFTVGVSNYSRDWFYAHVPRYPANFNQTNSLYNFGLKIKLILHVCTLFYAHLCRFNPFFNLIIKFLR